MELSKEEIKLLELVKNNDISLDPDYYYDNLKLQNLIHKKKLIVADMASEKDEDDFSTGLHPIKYSLTVDGENELSKSLELRKENRRKGLYYPLLTNSISAVIGLILGALATYLKMK